MATLIRTGQLVTPRFYIGSFTRDISAASGDVSYTGVGFTPTQVFFFGAVDSTNVVSIGLGNTTTTGKSISANGTTGIYTYDNTTVRFYTSAGNAQGGVIKTMDTDGFTITWTKAGTPTGTAQVFYLAFR